MATKSNNKRVRQEEARKKEKRNRIISICLALVTVIGVSALVIGSESGKTEVYAAGIEINKADIETNGYKFYPYNVDGKKLEVVAVKASDGTIRTAFNTCQVCYSSGRGYYEVEGKELVCKNCGNHFTFDQVQKEKGGCNPVPIMSDEKTEDNAKINITHELIEQNSRLFNTWTK